MENKRKNSFIIFILIVLLVIFGGSAVYLKINNDRLNNDISSLEQNKNNNNEKGSIAERHQEIIDRYKNQRNHTTTLTVNMSNKIYEYDYSFTLKSNGELIFDSKDGKYNNFKIYNNVVKTFNFNAVTNSAVSFIFFLTDNGELKYFNPEDFYFEDINTLNITDVDTKYVIDIKEKYVETEYDAWIELILIDMNGNETILEY